MSNRRAPHKQRTIEKIRNAKIVDRLIDHYNGKLELSATQVNVGLSLIKKYLPDIKVVEQKGDITIKQTVVNAQPALSAPDWQEKHYSKPTVN